MSISDEITRLNNAKAAIKQSIKNKGVDVSDSALLDEYPALIDKIEVGGGGSADPTYENIWKAITVNNTDYNGLFHDKYYITELNLSNLNTSNVTVMQNMFYNCNQLTTIGDISSWDTSSVQNMAGMFEFCSGLSDLEIGSWSTSSVTNMTRMFYGCNGLHYLYINSWDTCNVQDMSYMFASCGLYYLDLSGWYGTYNVQDMSYMFNGCGSLYELNLSNFDMCSVYNTDDMLASCTALHTLRLDYCSVETVEKIINSANFPAYNWNGTIYCSEDVYNNLTPPGSWTFEIVW